jgi:hypothetical protein
MTTHTPDPHAWLSQLDETPRSIDSLVDDGFEGFSLQDLTPWLGDASAMERITPITWVRTVADEEGEVAVMTTDADALGGLLDWMLEQRGQCPMVYAADDEDAADDHAMTVPDALPPLRLTAYNLPDGVEPEEALRPDLLEVLQQIFADMKAIYGEQAHLYRIDYGCFVDHMDQQGGVVLQGEFLDLDSLEIHTFTMDAIAQRLHYEATGRFLEGNSQSQAEGA